MVEQDAATTCLRAILQNLKVMPALQASCMRQPALICVVTLFQALQLEDRPAGEDAAQAPGLLLQLLEDRLPLQGSASALKAEHGEHGARLVHLFNTQATDIILALVNMYVNFHSGALAIEIESVYEQRAKRLEKELEEATLANADLQAEMESLRSQHAAEIDKLQNEIEQEIRKLRERQDTVLQFLSLNKLSRLLIDQATKCGSRVDDAVHSDWPLALMTTCAYKHTCCITGRDEKA